MKVMNLFYGLSFFVFITGAVAEGWYSSNIDFLNLTEEQSDTWWLIGFIRNIGFWLFCSLLIAQPTFNYLSTKKKKFKTGIFVGVGFNIIMVFGLSFAAYHAFQVPSLIKEYTDEQQLVVNDYLNFLNQSDMEIAVKVELSQKIASGFFVDYGIIVKVVDENGEQIDFVPTSEDLKQHNELRQTDKLLQHTKYSFLRAIETQIFILLMSLLVGACSFKVHRWYRERYGETA